MATINCNYGTLATLSGQTVINIPVNAQFRRIASFKEQPSGNDNRMIFQWVGPDSVEREYFVNQNTLNTYSTEAELKAALDFWTSNNFGYVFNCVWFHINDDGTWAVSWGKTPPDVWPEDMVAP